MMMRRFVWAKAGRVGSARANARMVRINVFVGQLCYIPHATVATRYLGGYRVESIEVRIVAEADAQVCLGKGRQGRELKSQRKDGANQCVHGTPLLHTPRHNGGTVSTRPTRRSDRGRNRRKRIRSSRIRTSRPRDRWD